MKEVVIFCECYGQQNYALQLAMQNCHDRPVTIVITGVHNLFKFFKVVNEKVFHDEINLIYVEPYPARRVKTTRINKIFRVIPDIIGERRYLKGIWHKYFAKLAGCEVFFFSRGFNGLTFYLLKKLIKRNRLVYVSLGSFLGPPYSSQYTPTNIVDLASLTISKLVYGRDIAMGKLPLFKGFLYMPDRFIEKEVDKVMDGAEIGEMMKGFDLSQFRIFDVGAHSIIYFDQYLIDVGYISDGDTYQRELASVFSVLGKYFPKEEIACKYHPEYEGDETVIKLGGILPSFIPAELLYNDKVKMYLGVVSRSIANVEKGLAVSLVDLITFKSDEIRAKLKEDLMEVSKSKILFPKSLDEFEQILIGLKEGRTHQPVA